MVPKIDHEIVVLGAGPAGTSMAIRLAELGFDVAIVERRPFPRDHVGICLSDTTVSLLDYLGIEDGFRASKFWRRDLTAVCWGDPRPRFVPQSGYHVNRGVLDQLLLERACRIGVSLYQPATLHAMDWVDGAGWRLSLLGDHPCETIHARFIADASGRLMGPTGLGRTVQRDSPPLLALHATWSIAKTPTFDGLIEAGDNAWLWYAQTAPDQALVSVFCDPRQLNARNGMQARYLELLQQFRMLDPSLLDHCLTPPTACDATSQHTVAPVGEHHICSGDACLAVDPLSSQGVHLSLQSGIQAAVVTNTLLRKPANAEAARSFYRDRARDRRALYVERARTEYAQVAARSSHPFWRERAAGAMAFASPALMEPGVEHREVAAPTDRVKLSPDVSFHVEPVIEHDLVEMRPVVRRHGIAPPVAYVAGVEVAGLLASIPPGTPFIGVPLLWRQWLPLGKGMDITRWLWSQGYLVPVV